MKAVRLTVSLRGFRPVLKRVIVVPADASLDLLHSVVQIVFDWDGDHLYVFENRRGRWGDPMLDGVTDDETVPVSTLASREGAAFTYTYDMGSWWVHDIAVESFTDSGELTCLSGVGPNPAEYDGEESTPFDLDEVNQRLAELDLAQFEPNAEAAEGPTPDARFAATVRELPTLAALLALARWAAPGRPVTPAGYLKRAEVAAAHEALGLPAPSPKFHSARNLPRFNGWWQTAADLGFVDVGAATAVDGPALRALDDDRATVELWLDLAHRSLYQWRAEHSLFHCEPLDAHGAKLGARDLLERLAAAENPETAARLCGPQSSTGSALLAQLRDLGLADCDDQNRWSLSEFGRLAVDTVSYQW
jgi:hypothetical protein